MILKGKRIFIVEDDSGNLAIASVYLEQAGAIVKFCRRSNVVTSTIMSALPIDIILMDLMLPHNVSGFDIYKELRKIHELACIPIVAVSASDPDTAIPRALSLGFSGFIGKPIPPRFSYYIAQVLDGKKVWIAEGADF